MTKSEDIVNLFQQFGGQVDDYQELSRQQSAQQAKKRWPLLSALELGQATAAVAPGVASAEAPVISGPVEFRPAPVAPPVQVLAPTGQHLSAAELAGGPPAPTLAPAPASARSTEPVLTSAPLVTAASAAPAAVAAPALAMPAAPAPEPAPATVAAVVLQPSAIPQAPAATPAPFLQAAPAPVSAPLAGTSLLAGLAQAPRPVPAPAATAPTTELEGIFARLAGRTEVAAAPPPSGLNALWQSLRGGA